MPYTNNVPQAAQTIASSQNQILQNFITIQQWTNVDHVEITGAGGNEGKHAKVSLIQQPYVAGGNFTPAIDAVSGVGTVGIYAARNTSNNGPSRMWAVIPRLNAASAFVTANVPFTQSSLMATPYGATPPVGLGGYTYLPSGIILQWGSFDAGFANITTFQTGTQLFTNQNGIAFPNRCLTVIISPVCENATTPGSQTGAIAAARNLTVTSFDWQARALFTNNNSTRSFRYLAIGF